MSEFFDPPYRILMGPGPSEVHPRVLYAQARPTVGHLDPVFVAFMEGLKAMLRRAFLTENRLTFPVSGPGSAGMELCIANLVEPGDRVVVAINGLFGQRMKENVERHGGDAVAIEFPWGTPIDPDRVEAVLPGARALAFVHAETSTGVRSDAAALCALAARHGVLSIVDAVTSLGGIPVEVDAWGADAVYSGSQKCLSCPPGLAPVTFSERAAEAVRRRRTKVRSWFFDLSLLQGYWEGEGGRTYHHTAPVNALYGLHEALLMQEDEGLKAAWDRHAAHHTAFAAGIEAMGLSFLVEEPWRLPQLNTVRIPEGIDEEAVRRHLLDDWSLEIGAGLGPLKGQVWRIGLMGQSCTAANVILCLVALEDALSAQGGSVRPGGASAAQAILFDRP
ncbi:MAG: alanine--glyoxylate aminotransferase family protein [Magnetospirillum sp. WYHS-4]